MNRQTQLAIFAIIAALGVLGVIAVESISIMQQQQQAYARGCTSGGAPSTGFNASQGRCFRPYLSPKISYFLNIVSMFGCKI